MNYLVWLTGLGLLFIVLERLWPWRRKQPVFRTGWFSDVLYIVFNSHYLGILLALGTQQLMRVYNLDALLSLGVMRNWPWWVQFPVVLIAFDFVQWSIHNLLHRVPWLWQFHKVHHSIVEMDWLGDWRFHWGEILVYRTLQYVPMAVLGASGAVLFWYGVLNTLIGHYAHANVRIGLGPLRYIFNTPQMHIWHHTHPDSGPINKNFAITLSVWDWLFGTAYWPETPEQPKHLGFDGIEKYPASILGQWVAPFRR